MDNELAINYFDEKWDLPSLLECYKLAFAGFPWFENLSDEEIHARWKTYCTKRDFTCLVAREHTRTTEGIRIQVVGAIWWDVITLENLEKERGKQLAEFARKTLRTIDEEEHQKSRGQWSVYPFPIWERDLIVRPSHQNQGIGKNLRASFLAKSITLLMGESTFGRCNSLLILTRMRDDNLPTLKIAEKLEFQRTEIRAPSSQKLDTFHEYWFKRVCLL